MTVIRISIAVFSLFFYLIFSGMLIGLPELAANEFDNDDEPVFEEMEIQIEPGVQEKPGSDSLVDLLLDNSAFTLGYCFSYGTDHPQKVIDHSPYLRVEHGSLVADRLFFKLDAKASAHLKEDHQAEAENKDILPDSRIREFYIQPGFENVTFTVGKQIQVWGKADTAAITDVLSPRDFSQFLFVELEDARQGQWMVSANIYADAFNTFVFVSPYPGRDREPDDATRYHRPITGEHLFTITKDRLEFGDFEFGFKLDKSISKTDVSLMGGRFFANAATYDFTGRYEAGKPVLEKSWQPFHMVGAAAAHAWQNFVFKLEMAYKNDFALQGMNAQNIYVAHKEELLDAALGIEYDANSKYRVTLELSNRHLISGRQGLIPGTDENSTSIYASFFKDFFNQTLDFEYIFYYHIQEKNRFHQFKLTYDLTDNIRLKADYTTLNATDTSSVMYAYQDEDRIGFEISYFF